MKVQHTSGITRYEGSYPSLSAFLMCPCPKESDSESFLSRAEGRFEGNANAFSLTYKEEDGVLASLDYNGKELHFVRGGTRAVFIPSKTTSFSHITELGAMKAEAYTTRLDVKEKDGKILLSVSYFMHISDIIQKNTMKWKLF